MSADLESKIRLIADAAFEETTAVDVDRRLAADIGPFAETSRNREPIMLDLASEPSPSPWRTRLLAVAASVVVVIAGVLAVELLRDDSDDSASIATSPSTTVASVDAAELAAIGERVMAAFNSRDSETLDDLVAADANPIAMIGVTTRSGLIDLLGYIEAADLGFDVQECVGSEPDQVRCDLLQRSGFADAAGVRPGKATMFLKIEDGQVVALRYGRAEGHGRAHDRFSTFISEIDPDAPEKMWWTTNTGEPYPLLTEESLELFERYVQEFIDSRS